jgi:menaquinone-dependent protoporphyrinogen IX oxidase
LAKTLIAYSTRGGVTKESANTIARVLKEKYGLEVDVVDLRKNHKSDISKYLNIVVGGGVRAGRIYGEALKFLDHDFGDRKVAFFISTMEVDEKARPLAEEKYIKKTLKKRPNLKPVASTLLGGRFKIFGRTFESPTGISNVEAWAEELGARLDK